MVLRWLKTRLKRCLLFVSFLSVVLLLSVCLLSAANKAQFNLRLTGLGRADSVPAADRGRPIVQFYPDNQIKLAVARNRDGKKIEDLPPAKANRRLTTASPARNNSGLVSSDVHIFYYAWYANPQTDGQWVSLLTNS